MLTHTLRNTGARGAILKGLPQLLCKLGLLELSGAEKKQSFDPDSGQQSGILFNFILQLNPNFSIKSII